MNPVPHANMPCSFVEHGFMDHESDSAEAFAIQAVSILLSEMLVKIQTGDLQGLKRD